MKRHIVSAFFILLVSGFPVLSAASEMITLELSGDAGQSFKGDCRLMQPNGIEKRHRIQGKIPTKIYFPATSVRCSLQKNNLVKTVTATLHQKNKIAISLTTHPALSWILISSHGPWGPPKAANTASRPVWQ